MKGAAQEAFDELVDKALSGDRTAFSTLVRQLMAPIAALTYRMTGDRDASKDLAQDTFVAAWESRKSFRREAGFTSWLYRIASNKTLNYLKSAKRQSPSQDVDQVEMTKMASNPEKEMIKKELASEVLGFMAGLPDQQRLIFDLRFYKEMSFHEIAELTGRALGTVKTGYREAIIKLRKQALEKGWQS